MACQASVADLSKSSIADAATGSVTQERAEMRLEAGEAARADLGKSPAADSAAGKIKRVRLEASETACPNLGIAAAAHTTPGKVEHVMSEAREATSPDLGIATSAHATPIVELVHKAGDASRTDFLTPFATDAASRRGQQVLHYAPALA